MRTTPHTPQTNDEAKPFLKTLLAVRISVIAFAIPHDRRRWPPRARDPARRIL